MHLKSIEFRREEYPSREHYPFCLEIFRQIDTLDLDQPVTLFSGENGSGKSTLLEAIAHRCGISIWRDEERRRCTNNPYEKKLYRFIEANWTGQRVPGSYFSSDIFYDFARFLDEWAVSDPQALEFYGSASLLNQSHGQSLMSYFTNRYRITGLYLLDEPETALSPRKQLELLKLIRETASDEHAQFIIATHSPILLSCPDAVIYSFDHIPIKRLSFHETEHFKIYRDFMNGLNSF